MIQLFSYPSEIAQKTSLFLHSNSYCNPLEITTTPPSLFRCGINLNFLRIFVKNTRFSIAFPQFTSSTAILTCGVMKSCKKAEFDWFKDKAYSPLQSQTKALVPVAKKSPGKRGRVLIRLTAGVSRLDLKATS